MLSEFLFKLFLTILVLFFAIGSLRWIWKTQIDTKETMKRLVTEAPSKSMDWVATRDPNKLYQDGQIVANVFGEVEESEAKIIFHELCDTEKLQRNQPIQYKRWNLKIVSIGVISGMKITMSSNKANSKKAVLKDVICDKIH